MSLSYVLAGVKSMVSRVDGDMVDTLNDVGTPALLIALAIASCVRQLSVDSVHCWTPDTFSDAMVHYTGSQCWMQGTYYLPYAEVIPMENGERQSRQMAYYQWLPLLLALGAVLCSVPTVLWKVASMHTGVQTRALVRTMCDGRLADWETKKRAGRLAAAAVANAAARRGSGSGVTALYLVTKLLYAAIMFTQLAVLSALAGTGYWHGLSALAHLLTGNQWPQAGNFPKVVLCDFEVRVLGNVHRHTVQCALAINMFNEKVLLCIWFWFFILACASIGSLIYWLIITLPLQSRVAFVSKYFVGKSGHGTNAQSIRQFVYAHLKLDGAFVLRMVASHAGDLTCYELIKALYEQYCDQKEGKLLHAS